MSQNGISLGKASCFKDTDKAVLILLEEETEEKWFPKSVVHGDSEVWKKDQHGNFVIMEWYAEKENLI